MACVLGLKKRAAAGTRKISTIDLSSLGIILFSSITAVK